jgi:glycosyltransferase involved in cell wall biosynthesis
VPLKKILVLTFYYTPDLCAGSFRAAAFIKALQKKTDEALHVEVLTTMPNRYHSFSSEALNIEQIDNVTIRRFEISSHKSGFIDQSLSFASYARQVLKHCKGKNYDLVFATSSRLMTATLGASIANRNQTPLYLDIRDIFTDTMADVLSKPLKIVFLPLFRLLERYTLHSATAINLVSKGFADYFRPYGDEKSLRFFTNGIDREFLDYDFQAPPKSGSRKVILFAGNIGEGQGLEKLIPQAAGMLSDRFDIMIIGDGGSKRKLVEACLTSANVKLLAPVSRQELKKHYARADILLMHLNDYEAFRKVLPSKIFEYAATGKPILAGVSGFAAEFTEKYVENAAVFQPCDAESMVSSLGSLDLSMHNRSDFKEQFSSTNIMENLAGDVLSLLSAA